DPKRQPRDWTDLIGSNQCAVFLKHRATSLALASDGKPYRDPAATTCFLFDRIDDARCFCDATAQSLPQLRCGISNSEGRSHPPLLVVFPPDYAHTEEAGSFWSRRRRLIAAVCFLVAPPLIWLDVRRNNTLILPTFLAFNAILAGLRFL